MDERDALDAFSALAQETRLRVFRLLMRQGPEGLRAGEIARWLGVPQNTLSSHLSVLSRAHLVHSRRDGRAISYSANMEGMRDLILYLTQDCCQGREETCGALVDEILPDCGRNETC